MAGFGGTRLGQFVKAIANTKALTVEYAAYDQNVLTQMANLNNDQMNEQGLFSDGTPTPDYTPYTIERKKEKGQRYDHMTFRDTGATQDSIIYLFNGDLVADWTDYNNIIGYLLNRDIDSTPIGLTEESITEIQPEIIENITDYIKSKL